MISPMAGFRRLPAILPAVWCLIACTPLSAQPRAVLILFDGLTASDLGSPRLPALKFLAKSGAVGLVNTAAGPGPREVAAVFAMALGIRTPAQASDAQAFQQDERVEGDPAAVVYRRRMGVKAPGGIDALHLGIAPLIRRHVAAQLPSALALEAGAPPSIAVCGNSDAGGVCRPVALFGTDETGLVRSACIGSECLLASPGRPWGVRDNVPLLLHKIAGWGNRVVVAQLGDGARAEAVRRFADPLSYRKAHEAALDTLDQFVGGLQRLPAPPRRIAVVAPLVSGAGARAPDRLALAIFWGEGIRPGVLTSATTRTRALIANVDVEPTLLGWLGIQPRAPVSGHPVYSLPAADALREVQKLDRRTSLNQRALVPLFLLLGGVLFVAVAAAAASTAGWVPGFPVRVTVLALMNMPLGLMVAAPVPFGSMAAFIAGSAGLLAVLALLQEASARILKQDAIVLFAACTGAVIAGDTLLNLGMIQFSVLSCYQIQGIRYYGVGNEYMGVLIGVALLWTCLRNDSLRGKLLVLAGVAVLLGAPWWGENAGGLVAAAVALGAVWWLLTGRRFGLFSAAGWAFAGLMGALAFAALDRTVYGSSAGHMGQAVAATHAAGLRYAANIAWRKALMNLRIASQPYTLAAVAGAFAITAIAGGFGRERLARLIAARPGWWRMRGPCVWSALAALVFNDSGIVPALFIAGAFLLSGLYYALLGSARPGGEWEPVLGDGAPCPSSR